MKWMAALVSLAVGCPLVLAEPSHGQTTDDEECRKTAAGVKCEPRLRPPIPGKPKPPAATPETRGPDIALPTGPARGTGAGPSAELRASRSFVGPHVLPPADFAAYGIVAFPYMASSRTLERHRMVCDAYVATLPRSEDLPLPRDKQMVTVWPIRSEKVARKLAAVSGSDACREAVDNYDLTTSLRALKDAQSAGEELGFRRGPFLLAWAPSSSKGKPDVLVLVADLTEKSDYDEVLEVFGQWRSRIEQEPELWAEGWSAEGLRVAVKEWADRVGPAVLKVLWKN